MVDARTSNGDIELRLGKLDGKGPLRTTTTNGRIDVTLDAGHDLTASTSNSSITVHLPQEANADVRARTSQREDLVRLRNVTHEYREDDDHSKTA